LAIDDEKVIQIPNRILRKGTSESLQNKQLKNDSICIVCDFRFLENEMEWSKKVKAICHPFKKTDIFPKDIKLHLLSESDFCSSLITPTLNRMEYFDNKSYDFVCFILFSKQGVNCKGLHILPMIDKAARQLGLRGLIINYATRETKKFEDKMHVQTLKKLKSLRSKWKNLTIIDKNFSTKDVCSIMNSVKFVLFPNTADASPRILAEAIVRGKPVVVNSNIYGGWKYVSSETGRFFDAPSLSEYWHKRYNKNECVESLRNAMKDSMILDGSVCKEWFNEKYGFFNSSVRLAKIINDISGTSYKAVAFEEWRNPLKTIARERKWIK